MKKLSLVIVLVLLLSSCGSGAVETYAPADEISPTEETVEETDIARERLSQMTLDEKIYQLIFADAAALEKAPHPAPVGGVIYFASDLKSRNQTAEMIRTAQSGAQIPLFIGVDEEGGRVSRLGKNGAMDFPVFESMAAVKTADRAAEIGRILGEQLLALGFNVDFAPVADVLVNKDNAEIGDRSFGTDAKDVSEKAAAFVAEMEKTGVSSVLKHFPGHGSAATNSHEGRAESRRSEEELFSCEFLPFKAGIDAGADFVLVSHMTLTEIDDCPASLSEKIVTGYLREGLSFDGIIITDALNMGAVSGEYEIGEAAAAAINAGCDMLLMPEDIAAAHDAIAAAVADGEIAIERIDESVCRILKIKDEKGLF